MSLSLSARRARLLVLRDLIDADGGGALWLFVDEAMPPAPTSAPTGAPAAIIPLGPVSFAMHATDASMECAAVGYAIVGGTVTFGRYVNGLGAGVLDETAGPPGSGAELIVSDLADIPTAQIWSGGELTVAHTLAEA